MNAYFVRFEFYLTVLVRSDFEDNRVLYYRLYDVFYDFNICFKVVDSFAGVYFIMKK